MKKSAWVGMLLAVFLFFSCLATAAAGEERVGNVPYNGLTVGSSADLSGISFAQSVLVRVQKGNVVGNNGKTLFALSELRDRIPKGVFPVCSVSTKADMEAVAALLKKSFGRDGAILSSEEAVLTAAFSTDSRIGRILDLAEKYKKTVTGAQCDEICASANRAGARAVLLSYSVMNRETVRRIRQGSISVWLQDTSLSD